MKTSILMLLLIGVTLHMSGQHTWVGVYEGKFGGDNITLTLEDAGKNSVTGKLKDAVNNYDFTGSYQGNTLKGQLVENTFGLTFQLDAIMKDNELNTTLSMDVFGTIEKMEFQLYRTGNNKSAKAIKNPVSGKTRDQKVVGTWIKESNYSSGYEFNYTYGSMSINESMVFHPDGRLSDGKSNTTIAGSYYTGQSTADSGKIIEAVFWYTEGKKIYLVMHENNKDQYIELGKYYIENHKMLITPATGEKLLLIKN
jgi:hypothetical protein